MPTTTAASPGQTVIPPLVVSKIGGGAFSNKETGESFKIQVFARVARETPLDSKVVYVLGAGWDGHNYAKNHGLELKSGSANPETFKGKEVLWTRLSNMLNREVVMPFVNTMEEAGHKVKQLSTGAFFERRSGVLQFNPSLIVGTLERGIIPVLNGDGILDSVTGHSILSGDTITVHIANAFQPGTVRAVFFTAVDGILDNGGHVIPRLRFDQLLSVNAKKPSKKVQDVTGGMKGKIEELLNLRRGIPVTIANGRKDGNISKALAGQKVGTLVTG